MYRKEEIEENALEYNWILKERGDVNFPDNITVGTFIEGAKWADNNPSDEVILRIISLSFEWGKKLILEDKHDEPIMKEYVENISKKDNNTEDEINNLENLHNSYMVRYIKEHFNENS